MHRLSVMAKETYGEKKTSNPEGVSVDLTDVSFAKVINDGIIHILIQHSRKLVCHVSCALVWPL